MWSRISICLGFNSSVHMLIQSWVLNWNAARRKRNAKDLLAEECHSIWSSIILHVCISEWVYAVRKMKLISVDANWALYYIIYIYITSKCCGFCHDHGMMVMYGHRTINFPAQKRISGCVWIPCFVWFQDITLQTICGTCDYGMMIMVTEQSISQPKKNFKTWLWSILFHK